MGCSVSAPAVKVLIAVAVDTSGEWAANGRSGRPSEDSAMFVKAAANLGPEKIVHWVEAWLPLPERRTFAGFVKDSP